ncbi:small GTP-binding protein [Ignisphaera aggregans DSM 17230]|uniref:Ferrous iron transport protein B n=1 Tax=Ignisphaera aggregans (strain DSM 17230 / JCM 13409 / AQ1.S1) TaxID=583356 RepID=E0SPQ2_IGNAA|nr:small GTP-binding protein [Ignisphaera aggregans DSM 17230]
MGHCGCPFAKHCFGIIESIRRIEEETKGCDIRVALIGQPSVGKSALFNALTGASVKVASFPGTTVEYKVGRVRYKGRSICVVDLPGIYTLMPYTLEETITKLASMEIKFDWYLVLVDSTRFERTFYLALKVLELFPNTVVILSKWDYTKKLGIEIDIQGLSKHLGVPVVATSAVTGYGLEELLDTIISRGNTEKGIGARIWYEELNEILSGVIKSLGDMARENRMHIDLFGAILNVLEGDEEVARFLSNLGYSSIVDEVRKIRDGYGSRGQHLDTYIAKARYRYIDRLVDMYVSRKVPRSVVRGFIDAIFMNRFLGPLTGILTVLSIFIAVFIINTGFPLNIVFSSIGLEEYAEYIESYSLSGLIGQAFDYIINTVYSWLEGFNTVLADFIANGIIGAVSAVLSFLPLVFMAFIFLSIIEDSGLGPRIAVALHSGFRAFGLSGRAIYPFMISLGCNVPGVLASRTSMDSIERLEIIISTPFVICQARLVILLALVSALFPGDVVRQVATVATIYLGSLALYLLTAKIVRMFIVRERSSPELLLELPEVHMPSAKAVWWDSISLTKHFLKKAGTVIFGLGIVMWFMLSYGFAGYVEDVSQSFATSIGNILSPIFAPLGVAPSQSWVLGLALFAGFIAKEGILSMLNQIYGELSLSAMGVTTIQGLAFIVLFMYYIPCMATLATIYQETRSVKLTLFSLVYSFIIALILSYTTYIVLSLL